MNYLHLIIALSLLALPTTSFADEGGDEESSDSSDSEDSSETEEAPKSEDAGPTETAADDGEAADSEESEAASEAVESTPDATEESDAGSEEDILPEDILGADPEESEDGGKSAEALIDRSPATVQRSEDGYRKLGLAFSLSFGGGRLASVDSGYASLRGDDDMHFGQIEAEVLLLPRLAVAGSVIGTSSGGARVQGGYDEQLGSSGSFSVEPRLTSWDVSVRLVPTPPFFPIRGYVRLGGGVHHVHVRVSDDEVYDNLGQRDERGLAGFALMGVGTEIGSPTAARGRSLPVTAALVLEGGARVGGGGDLVAAPSADLGSFGRLDLGPWYFRAAFKLSFWPSPRASADASQ